MKRKQRPKKENSERWLLTYSDMITLLLVFFIVLYTLSRVDAQKFQNLSASLSKALGSGGVILNAPGPSVVPGISGAGTDSSLQTGEAAQLESIRDELQRRIMEANLQARISATVEERGVVLSFQDEVLFKLGSAELTPRAREILSSVGPILEGVPNYLRVEGHTDNLPIHTAEFPSNWELSSARANAVLQELLRNYGIHPQRISSIAYGQYRPVAPNDSSTHMQLNRRVSIVVLSSKYSASESGLATVGLQLQH